MESPHSNAFYRQINLYRFPPIQQSSYSNDWHHEKGKNYFGKGKIKSFESELLTPLKNKFPSCHSVETKKLRFLKENNQIRKTNKPNFLKLVDFYKDKVNKWRKGFLQNDGSLVILKPIPLKRIAPSSSLNPISNFLFFV